MPRVLVTSDEGRVFWDERVVAADFAIDHFRQCLIDRLGWAVADAQKAGPRPGASGGDRELATRT